LRPADHVRRRRYRARDAVPRPAAAARPPRSYLLLVLARQQPGDRSDRALAVVSDRRRGRSRARVLSRLWSRDLGDDAAGARAESPPLPGGQPGLLRLV